MSVVLSKIKDIDMKLLKWLFGEKNEGCAEIVTSSMDEYKASYEAEQLRIKLVWEANNDLQKKLDACYLGTRKKAFYGTFEEYKESCFSNSGMAGLVSNSSMAVLAGLQNLAAQQQMSYSNPYRCIAGQAGGGNFWNGILG